MDNITYKINDLENIEALISASNAVYTGMPDEANLYHNSKDWMDKVLSDGYLITAYMDNKIVGFALCEKKTIKLSTSGTPEYCLIIAAKEFGMKCTT